MSHRNLFSAKPQSGQREESEFSSFNGPSLHNLLTNVLDYTKSQRRQREETESSSDPNFLLYTSIKALKSAWIQRGLRSESDLHLIDLFDLSIKALELKHIQMKQIEELNQYFEPERFYKDDLSSFIAKRTDFEVESVQNLDSDREHSFIQEKFTDHEFPPSLESLIGDLSSQEIEKYLKKPMSFFEQIVWLRADEFLEENYQIFDNIEPNDIKQGNLGNCYVLSSIAALAEKEDRIKILFLDTEANSYGRYTVRICDGGKWKEVTVDDYFPCNPKTKKPIFAGTNGNELWALILEKAWAKVYKSYARTVSGRGNESLHDFTGAPTKCYSKNHNSQREIWNAFIEGEAKNYVMTCSTVSDKSINKDKIFAGHAYSLLAALTVKDRNGKYVRLVKLRNPWGRGEWKGAWSDASTDWTPELKRRLNVENRDDGIFFMKFEDMLKYFGNFQICQVHDDYVYKSLQSSCDRLSPIFFDLKVNQSGSYYITINQENKRNYAKRDNYTYSQVSIALGKKTHHGYEHVRDNQLADKEVWIWADLNQEEDYRVRVQIDWNKMESKEFTISSYGEGEAWIEEFRSVSNQRKPVSENTRQQPIQHGLDDNCDEANSSDDSEEDNLSDDNNLHDQ